MEYEQIAESIVRVTKRVALRRITPSLNTIQTEAANNRPASIRTAANNRATENYLYLLSFDLSMGIPDQWVDGKTLAYFNSLRSNIYVSSSMFDTIHLNDQQNRRAITEPQRQ
jgi:hypothetical protein